MIIASLKSYRRVHQGDLSFERESFQRSVDYFKKGDIVEGKKLAIPSSLKEFESKLWT